jgi:HAE1 family hydrophobic/amphiphilic exporter-1
MSKFFINRPIVAMVISIIMVIIGVVAMVQLPIAQYPDLAPPEILVQATYVGADSLTLEQSVATPIEQQMQGVDRMLYMNSVNDGTGVMKLRVTFEWGPIQTTISCCRRCAIRWRVAVASGCA